MNHKLVKTTNYKKGLTDTLLFRSYDICADYSILHNEIKYLKSIWQKNSFPLFLLIIALKIF